MKALSKLNIAFLIILIGILFSCKNNQDGYSDEIETGKTVDAVGKESDTANTNKSGITPAGSTTSNNTGSNTTGVNTTGVQTRGTNNTESNGTGSGIGPGENTNDASTYSSSSGVQKDSISSGNKSSKKKTK